jgi:hypothetical protein
MLKFDPRWHFAPPHDGEYKNTAIPKKAIKVFLMLIEKTSVPRKRWRILEQFKISFRAACGESYMKSSSESWAESDMTYSMNQVAKNAPVFLDAFYSACEKLRAPNLYTPDAEMINDICKKYKVGYSIRPPNLVLRGAGGGASVPVSTHSQTLTAKATEQLQKSLQRSDTLLSDGNHLEAVQATLWVLESLATAFQGVRGGKRVVKGKYFNEIVKDLRNIAQGSSFEIILGWMKTLPGYLSSPTGGGVRHGLDLKNGVPIEPAEARLFCNLIRSYAGYLIAKHEELSQ